MAFRLPTSSKTIRRNQGNSNAKFAITPHRCGKVMVKKRDFYFRALGSLVVLSFPQPLSFSSVFPKPFSETLTRSSDGRNPV
jgi:hypothetical protein